MLDASTIGVASLEVIPPYSSPQSVRLTEFPFLLGRGDAGNHFAISDMRISRQCAAIVCQEGCYYVEDRGQRSGVFVNEEKTSRRALADGDVITFGLDDSYKLIFRSPDDETAPVQYLLTQMDNITGTYSASGGLGKLNLLLEATKLLHSELPLDAVLDEMLDRAITIADADRGLLLEADTAGSLRPRLARRKGPARVSVEDVSPSQTAVSMALEKQSGIITADLREAEEALQAAKSIVAQRLRAVIAIPLYSMSHATSTESTGSMQRVQLLGVLYLDSQRPAAFSKLDRQILDAIAVQSASILDNARMVKRERERQRIEHELSIARDIQQALLPRGFRDFPHLTISGMNSPCHAVGGDYFDILPIDDHHTAFLIADVSGKGLGAALVTTMLQGTMNGMTAGSNPVQVFERINYFLCEHPEVGKHATVFFGTLDRDGNLEYVNAGHPSPLLLSSGGVSALYTAGSLPLGLIPEANYTAAHARLEPGDTLVLFSDGVTEAEDRDEQLFGFSRLQDILTTHHDTPLDRLQETVIGAVERFASGASQADDITLLLVRYHGAVADLAPEVRMQQQEETMK